MKHLKMSMYLLLTAVIFTSCEKETTTLSEEQNLQELEVKSLNKGLNNAGSDVESNIDITNLPQNMGSKNSIFKSQSSYKTTNGAITFYSDSEEFDAENCTNLQMEDFEEARVAPNQIASFYGPLDENTNNYIFIPGEIVQGVFFDTDYQDTQNMAIRDFSQYTNQSKRLSANFATHNLLINFTTNNITSVKLDVFLSYVSGNIDIEIYGNSGLLGSANIFAEFENGTFFGIKSLEPIVQIKIVAPVQVNSSYVWERIDNLSFGNCDYDGDGVINEDDLCANTPSGEEVNSNGCAESQLDNDNDGVMNTIDNCSNTPSGEAVNENGCGQSQLDYDNDGVMNNKDAHIYSNLSTFINIGGFYPNVKNKLVRNGSTMMDQITDLINEINAEYNGSNYEYLHRKFIMLLERKATDWRRNRLITNKERDAISRSASSAIIPYYNNEQY